jgi:C4-type Zn-finger protein
LNNIRRDPSRHFKNKKKAYLKVKIEERETNSKINKVRDLYRGINDLKKGYQPRTTIIKDEKGDLVADPPQYNGEVEELFLPAIKCT